MKHKTNLWNINKNRIQQVHKYINGLQPKSNWQTHQDNYFNNLKKELLKINDSNTILERIGYNPIGKDNIYNEIDKQGVNQ